MPPQVNAHVTRVVGQGTADDWDRPASDGAQKWVGRAAAYYREKVDRVTDGAGSVNVLVRRTVWVDTSDLDAMALDTDDVITIEPDGRPAITSPARTIARSALADAPTVSTTRIDLEDG